MKLLLDTHALLWWLADDRQLDTEARALIQDADTEVFVSVASLWEIAIKAKVGKLHVDIGGVYEAVFQDGFALLDLRAEHLIALTRLPTYHRDPFDHLLIAQAIAEQAVFMSADRHTPNYPVTFIPCSGPQPQRPLPNLQ